MARLSGRRPDQFADMRIPIHRNMSTAFVDLTALVNYLRSLEFVGSVHLELCAYEAEIVFTPTKHVRALEKDHSLGRTARGRAALKRILVRSRDPHGRITVYRDTERPVSALIRVFIDEEIRDRARRMAAAADSPDQSKKRRPESPTDLPALEALVAELLKTIDEALARSNLTFSTAFTNASIRLKDRHPCLDPASGAVAFRNGTINVSLDAGREELFAGLAAALRELFQRLSGRRNLEEIRYFARQRVRLLAIKRKDLYKKYEMMKLVDPVLYG